MAIISVKSLLEAGVHFGHRVSRWNPKMAPYIFTKRNLIHIINLKETVRGLIRGYFFLKKMAANGEEILFVGTKRQAKPVIRREATRCEMHYVAERWLGGTLTNFSTIRKRLSHLERLEKMEEDGTMDSLSKKRGSALRREKRKIHRNLEGVRNMEKLPGVLIIVDPQKEHIAVKEAAKLNIPTICLMDTDSDPDLVDIPIPGNDDAMRSIEVICTKLTDAIIEGQVEWKEKQRLEAKRKAEAAKESGGKEGASEDGRGDRRDRRRPDDRGRRRGRNDRNRRGNRGRRRDTRGERSDDRTPRDQAPRRPEDKPAAKQEAKPVAKQEAKPVAKPEAKPAKEEKPVAKDEK